jgi:hypothetical protein
MQNYFMKKIETKIKTILAVSIAACFVIAGGGNAYGADSADGLTLDDVSRRTAERINTVLPENAVLAVLGIYSTDPDVEKYSSAVTQAIIPNIEGNILNLGKLRVTSRRQINRLFEELDFNLSGAISDESAKSIGKMLGADVVVIETLSKLTATTYSLLTEIIDAETAEVYGVFTYDISNDRRFLNMIGRGSSYYDEKEVRRRQNDRKSLLGYNYVPWMPLGFTIGELDGITSWNFLTGDDTKTGFEWTLGYTARLFEYSTLVIGFGGNHTHSDDGWHHGFVMEGGLLLHTSIFYVIGTYRLTRFNESGFAVGGGIRY